MNSRAAVVSLVLGRGDEGELQVSLPLKVTLNFSKATIPQKVNRKSMFWELEGFQAAQPYMEELRHLF